MKFLWILPLFFSLFPIKCTAQTGNYNYPDKIKAVLDAAKPLKFPRGNRIPLFLAPAMDPGKMDAASAENLVKEMDRRGVGIICSWSPGNAESLENALVIARAQKKMGVPVCVNATSCMYSFFNGDAKTSHIDKNGKTFFDDSFGSQKMGCPFTLDFRKKAIREQIEYFADTYVKEGINVDFVWTDWEIDGPIEVNGAWEASKKCTRCMENIPKIEDFGEFQRIMREMRSYLQFYAYSEPMKSRFPDILICNYAVNPHDGYRYWYDYFEKYAEGQPYKTDGRAKYRKWYDDFPLTGYTYAMPTLYTWYWTFGWYDFDNSDYRWFYNMLLEGSSVAKSTPANIPIVSFIRWHTTELPKNPDPAVKQFGAEKYQELLWHLMLRGFDTFYVWCGGDENFEETRLAQEVYAQAQEYGDFLERGTPITFDVPTQPGTVISGIALGNRVLVRRTDFSANTNPVEIRVGVKNLKIPAKPGLCQIINM